MAVYFPDAIIEVAEIPLTDGLQVQPFTVIHAPAGQMNLESGTQVDGRYLNATGEITGKPTIKPADAYIDGSADRTGRAFTINAGTWGDDYVLPEINRYGLCMPDGSLDVVFDVQETAAFSTTGLTHSLVVLRRGIKPPTADALPTACYASLELCHGDVTNYRVVLKWGQPISLDYYDVSNGWQIGVAVCRDLGNIENYLAHNNGEIRLSIIPDLQRNIMIIEVGDGHFLRHSPPRPINSLLPAGSDQETTTLPQREQFVLAGKNGWVQMWIFPLRYAPARVQKKAAKLAEPLPNIQNAQMVHNSLGRQDPDTQYDSTFQQDGDGNITFDTTATNPDAGDDLGSAYPPTISDAAIIIDSVWQDVHAFFPILPIPENFPPGMLVEELEVWDEVTRFTTSTAQVTVNNRSGLYSGNFGNYSYNIVASNGSYYLQRQRGIIAPSLTTYRQDPVRLMQFTGHDFSYKLGRPLGMEFVFDGWCLYSAVHAVLDTGQVAPKFRQSIPFWPYGPAGEDCPYPILGRGFGNNPKYRFPPEVSCLSVLLQLVQDSYVDPFTGASFPFQTGQDPYGNWHFEPWDPRFLPLTKYYSDIDPTGFGQISELQTFNSVENMRTALDFMGQDPNTGELLWMHLPMPWNIPAVGYRYPWLERNVRWATQAYLERLAESAAIQASIPLQTVQMKVPFDPTFHAGQLCFINSQFDGLYGYYISIVVRSRYGHLDLTGHGGGMVCESDVTCRAAVNLISF
jgi:hypothetical protein